jgi:hypothetical protein
MAKLLDLPRLTSKPRPTPPATVPPKPTISPKTLELEWARKVAIRLADEGVPLGAILRALKVEYELLRDILGDAQERGQIIVIPREDWPPGNRREERYPSSIPAILEANDVIMAIMRTIKATPTQSALLAALLRRPDMTKEALHHCIQRPDREPTDQKIVDVLICNLRKKLPPGVKVDTLWGRGYGMTPTSRATMIEALDLSVAQIEGRV